MKNYFDFIMYLAFQTILAYENKRTLTIEQLHNYRVKLIEKNINFYSQFTEFEDENFEEKLKNFHKTNINMSMDEESKNFKIFINDNDMFFYENGLIKLKEDVSYTELEDAKFELDSYSETDDVLICSELIGVHDDIECLDVLGAQKVKEFVYKIINDEKKIENAYNKYDEIELQEAIRKTNGKMHIRLSFIGNLPEEQMRCCNRTINSAKKLDLEVEGENSWLISDQLMEIDKFYNLHSKTIDNYLCNHFQRAIFDTGILAYDSLGRTMSAMWAYREPDAVAEISPIDFESTVSLMEEQRRKEEAYEDEFEEDEELDSDDYENEEDMDAIELYLYDKKIEMAFYLNYIKNITEFQLEYGSNEVLDKSKRRLLYLLDSYKDNLYKKENFEKALRNNSIEGMDYKEDLAHFYVMSRLFLIDILEGWIDDNLTLRKILFVSTYYDLTKDKRIKKIINKYKKTDNGKKVIAAIFEHQYNKFDLSTSQFVKKLQKKNSKDIDSNENKSK